MRMPLTEFLSNGDLKFMILLTALLVYGCVQFFKKIQEVKGKTSDLSKVETITNRLKSTGKWALVLALLSLLLGLMHSFYFIGKAGSVAPGLLYQGMSYVLVTPVFGVVVYMICRLFLSFFNPTKHGLEASEKS